MSKLIKVTPEYLDQVRKDFEEVLTSGKFSDGKITFSKTIGIVSRRAKIFFTPEAWGKMKALVSSFDNEVAWHGVAYRDKDETKDNYYISDILVYPQEVTGATVNTDQEKYEMWLMSHDDDIFNNIRMQGHSHVNMGVTPSSVDKSLYERILDQIDDDMFYIFMIWNKKKDKTVKIYDLKKNIFFDTSDVTVEVLQDSTDVFDNITNLSDEETEAVMQFLKKFKGVIAPDFSLYSDMPKAMQIWQCYKARVLTRYWQDNGIDVIPNATWSDESSYSWCFDGLPKNSTIAVSSVGCVKNPRALLNFCKGFSEMDKRLSPTKILFYGVIPESLKYDKRIIQIATHMQLNLQNLSKEAKI